MRFGKFLGLLLLVFVAPLSARATICLNMIVKNEAHCIERCLKSVRPFVDSWVIVDTGSTDGTQQLVRSTFTDLPGELHERPWKDFAHNRNEALALAKGKADYILIIDADDYLTYPEGYQLPELVADQYLLEIVHGGLKYNRPQLIRNCHDWKWHGVLHEYLAADTAKTCQLLTGLTMQFGGDGARSCDPDKRKKDIAVLLKGLEEEPTNSRYVFYLAQTYKEANEPELALEWYRKRVAMGGAPQEVWISLLQIGRMEEKLGRPCVASYWDAYQYLPSRAEPLFYIASWYSQHEKQPAQSYLLTKAALALGQPDDIQFAEQWIYDWGLQLEYSIGAYYSGYFEEAYQSSIKLLGRTDLPERVRQSVQTNLTWILPAMNACKELR
jgi:glycosyltransferase involved in cell wall biosynthesis